MGLTIVGQRSQYRRDSLAIAQAEFDRHQPDVLLARPVAAQWP
jgi:hypothetical protein